MGRNASAYIVTWDIAKTLFPTQAAFDDICVYLNSGGDTALPENQDWLEVYSLPWNLFVWKGAHCASENYHFLRNKLPLSVRHVYDELFGKLFLYWFDAESTPTVACRYADDLEYFVGQADTDAVISLGPQTIQHLLELAHHLDWQLLEECFEPQTPDWYIPDFASFQAFILAWVDLLRHVARQEDKGLIVAVE